MNKQVISIGIGLEFIIYLVFLSIYFILSYFIPISAIRSVLGAIFIFVFPGYAMLIALFPQKDDLNTLKRLTLSLGLSIVVMVFIGLILNYTPWGIKTETVLISINLFILLCFGIAYFRMRKLLVEEHYSVQLDRGHIQWQGLDLKDKAINIILLISMLTSFGSIFYSLAKPINGENFTEFYIKLPTELTKRYPIYLNTGQPIKILIGLKNNEHKRINYRIIRDGSMGTEEISNIWIDQGKKWEQMYTFSPDKTVQNAKIVFNLFKGDSQEPYRSLHFWFTSPVDGSH